MRRLAASARSASAGSEPARSRPAASSSVGVLPAASGTLVRAVTAKLAPADIHTSAQSRPLMSWNAGTRMAQCTRRRADSLRSTAARGARARSRPAASLSAGSGVTTARVGGPWDASARSALEVETSARLRPAASWSVGTGTHMTEETRAQAASARSASEAVTSARSRPLMSWNAGAAAAQTTRHRVDSLKSVLTQSGAHADCAFQVHWSVGAIMWFSCRQGESPTSPAVRYHPYEPEVAACLKRARSSVGVSGATLQMFLRAPLVRSAAGQTELVH